MKIAHLCLILIFVFQSLSVYASPEPIIGWLERVEIEQGIIQMNAKIDTGADTSSINAKILSTFIVNDEDWINFELINKQGQHVSLKRKIIRYAKIKRKLASNIKRPVIKLDMCIGNIHRKVEVNLAKRENFKYSLLIGRNYLRDFFIVDVAKQYSIQPNCSNTELINKTGQNNVQ